MRRAVLLVAVAVAAAAVAAVLSVERGPTATLAATGLAAQGRSSARAAFDGTNWLVVWPDERRGTGSTSLFGRLFSKDGVAAGPAFAISSRGGNQADPVVAFAGQTFVVVWLLNGFAVHFTRIDRTGTVLDPLGAPLVPSTSQQRRPAVGVDGNTLLIAWDERRGTVDEIHGARISADGTILDPTGITISDATGGQVGAQVVGRPAQGFLVIWSDYRDVTTEAIYGARVATSGPVMDPNGVLLVAVPGHSHASPTVATNGTSFLLAWLELTGSANCGFPNCKVYAAEVTAGLQVLQDAGVPLILSGGELDVEPYVGFDGTRWVVGYWQDAFPSIARVGFVTGSPPALQLLPGVTQPGGYIEITRLDCAAGGCVMSFVDYQSGRGDFSDSYRVMVFADAGVAPTVPTFSGSGGQYRPSLVKAAIGYFMVWSDWRSGDADIYGARLSPSGDVIDLNGKPITAVAGNQEEAPVVAFDGTQFLVVWEDSRNDNNIEIYGARVRPDGSPIDMAGFPIATGGSNRRSPKVGWDGTAFVVTWTDVMPQNSDAGVKLARVLPDRTVIDAGTPIGEDRNEWLGGMACKPGECLIGFTRVRGVAMPYAVRVVDGVSRDGTGMPLSVPPAEGSAAFPATDGNSYFLVWGVPGDGTDLAGTTLSGDGMLGPVHVVSRPLGQGSLVPLFNGSLYQVIFSEWATASRDLYTVDFGPSGFSAPTAVAAGHADAISPAAVGDGDAGAIVAFARFDAVADPISRIRVSGLVSLPPGRSCTAAAECSSGACEEVCCQATCDGGAFDCASCLMPDAGPPDAGPPDAGDDDGGVLPDAGLRRPLNLNVGCACSSSPPPLILLVIALSGLRRRLLARSAAGRLR